MCPLDREVDVISPPHDQRRSAQLAQLGLDRDRMLVVEGYDEALQIARTLLAAQMRP